MKLQQVAFGACVAAALVFGGGAGPAPATAAPQLWVVSLKASGDRVLSAGLDALGEIKARIRQF